MELLLVLVVVSAPGAWAFAKDPDCTGVERWPASMAFVHLKNAGLIDNERIDFTKTSVVRLAGSQNGTQRRQKPQDSSKRIQPAGWSGEDSGS